VRDHVNNGIIRRLLNDNKDVTPVSTVMFQQLIRDIEPTIKHYARKSSVRAYQEAGFDPTMHLPFTQDDFEGFFILKVHQVLARGNYDPNRSAKAYFGRVFTNLTRDIIRGHRNAIKMGLDSDLLDSAFLDLWGDR